MKLRSVDMQAIREFNHYVRGMTRAIEEEGLSTIKGMQNLIDSFNRYGEAKSPLVNELKADVINSLKSELERDDKGDFFTAVLGLLSSESAQLQDLLRNGDTDIQVHRNTSEDELQSFNQDLRTIYRQIDDIQPSDLDVSVVQRQISKAGKRANPLVGILSQKIFVDIVAIVEKNDDDVDIKNKIQDELRMIWETCDNARNKAKGN